jgi:predicted HTH transcriptional regulator
VNAPSISAQVITALCILHKEKLPDGRVEKRHVFKTVVAFANGDGGTLLFGIDDGGELRGINDNLPQGRRRLNDLLRDLVGPSPRVRIEAHRLDGKNVIVLEVLSSGGVLHALTLDQNEPEYYVRRDGTTFYAHPNELAAVVQRGSQAPGALPWFAQP